MKVLAKTNRGLVHLQLFRPSVIRGPCPIIQILTSKIDIFFRGFKTTGPFVTMIYRMVANDLFRFCIVFFIFVMGFGQCNMIFLIINLRSGWNFEKSNILFTFFLAFYIIFMSYIPEDDEENDSGIHMMPTISEAILNVFMISLGNFGDIWDALAATNHQTIGEVKTLYNKPLVRVICFDDLE